MVCDLSHCPTERCSGQAPSVAPLRGLPRRLPLNANVSQTEKS